MAKRPSAPRPKISADDIPAISAGTADADFTVPYHGNTLGWREGQTLTADRALRLFLDQNDCPVTWDVED
jgi:hypothetical protein